jgi:putative lipoic acid-binding regulatory protein
MIDKAIVAAAKYEDVKATSLKTQAELGLKGAQTEKALAEAAKAQREKIDTPFGKVDPDKFTPESLDKFRESGNYADLVAKPDKAKAPPSVGTDREAIAQDMYGTDFYSLTQEQKRAVNKKADERAERLKPSLSVTLPKNLKSIGDVREQFTTSVKPYITAANAAEQSEAMIDQASKGNFQGWRAAITQLAKSVGDSQISRAEIEAYGIDPSLVGSIVDRTSIFLSGTPSQDTINSAKKIASLVKKVNQDRAKQEQGTFLELATQAEGYNPKTTPRFFELPFAPTKQEVQEGTTSSGTKYKLTIK